MAKRSSTGSTVAKVLAIVALVIVVLLVVGEILLRVFVAHQMRSGFEEQAAADGVTLQEEPEVSFGAVPLLWGLVQGRVNEVSMNTPSTLQIDGDNVSGQPGADIQLNGLHLNDSMNADTLTTTTEVPDDYLLAIIRQQIAQNQATQDIPFAEHLTVTDITSMPDTDTLDVEFVYGAAVLSLTPVQQDGHLTFEASGAELFGIQLPEEATSAISDALQQGLTEEALSGGTGMQMRDFQVVDGGVRMTVVGENVPLRELASSTEPAQ